MQALRQAAHGVVGDGAEARQDEGDGHELLGVHEPLEPGPQVEREEIDLGPGDLNAERPLQALGEVQGQLVGEGVVHLEFGAEGAGDVMTGADPGHHVLNVDRQAEHGLLAVVEADEEVVVESQGPLAHGAGDAGVEGGGVERLMGTHQKEGTHEARLGRGQAVPGPLLHAAHDGLGRPEDARRRGGGLPVARGQALECDVQVRAQVEEHVLVEADREGLQDSADDAHELVTSAAAGDVRRRLPVPVAGGEQHLPHEPAPPPLGSFDGDVVAGPAQHQVVIPQ